MKSRLSRFVLYICIVALISGLALVFSHSTTQPQVLIIKDELPQMEELARFLKEKGSLSHAEA